MSGARALVQWLGSDASGSPTTLIAGMFTNVSYHVVYGTQAVFILGRMQAAEIEYTHMEPVSIQMSGWRAWKHGPYADGNIPKLKDLLSTGYCSLIIYDRVGTYTDAGSLPLAKITKVRPSGYSTTITSRQLSELGVTAVGLLAEDETSTGDEEPLNGAVIF